MKNLIIRDTGGLTTLVLMVLVAICLAFSSTIDAFTFHFLEHRSEYRTVEQLSKFMLLLLALVCIGSIHSAKDLLTSRTAGAYLLFAVAMYLGESNMIKAKYQPVCAALILPFLGIWLLQARRWLSILILGAGLFCITLGVLNDGAQEGKYFAQMAPEFVISLVLSLNEEWLDIIGICFIALSGLLFMRDRLGTLTERSPLLFALVILLVLLTAVGNGFSHFQYDPSPLLWILGLLLAVVGMGGFFLLNQQLQNDPGRFFPSGSYKYYAFILLLFVVFPSMWSYHRLHSGFLFLLVSVFVYFFYRDAKVQQTSTATSVDSVASLETA